MDLNLTTSFAADETLTNTKLNGLMDTATVVNAGTSDAATSTGSFILKSATAPASPYDNQFWMDTTLDMLKRYDTSLTAFVPLNGAMSLENGGGLTVEKGDLLVQHTSTANAFATSTSDAFNLGVAAETISPGNVGMVVHQGHVQIDFDGAATAGDIVAPSLTLGKGTPSGGPKTFSSLGIVLNNNGGATLTDCILFL